jgi:hypothetical protein
VSAVDRCVFFNEHTWVTLHVDDLMIVSDRDGDIDLIKRSLSEKYGSITCKESRKFKYLGMDIERFPGEIKISMTSTSLTSLVASPELPRHQRCTPLLRF